MGIGGVQKVVTRFSLLIVLSGFSAFAQATVFEQALLAMRNDPQRFDQFIHLGANAESTEWRDFSRLHAAELQILAAMAAFQLHAYPDALAHAEAGLAQLPARYEMGQYLRLTMAKTLALVALGDGQAAAPILQRELAQGGAVHNAMRHSLLYAQGRYEQFIGQGVAALQSLRAAYELAPTAGVLINKADIAVALGDLLMRSEQFTDAELYYRYADHYYREANEENGRAEVAVQRSLSFLIANNLSASREVLDGYLLYHLARGNRDAIAFGEKIVGCIARSAQSWPLALQHLERAEAIFASTQNRAELRAVQLKKASVLVAMGREREALPLLEATAAEPQQSSATDRLVAHGALAQLSERKGDFANAYQHLKQRDSVKAKLSSGAMEEYRLPEDDRAATVAPSSFNVMLWSALFFAVLLCAFFAWRLIRWRQLAECDDSTGLLNSRGLSLRWALYSKRSTAQTVVMVELSDALHWSRICGYANSELAVKTWVLRLRQQVPASVVIARIDVHRIVMLWPLPASAVNNQLLGLSLSWARWHLPLPEHLMPTTIAMTLTVSHKNDDASAVLNRLDGQLYLQQHPELSDANVASVEVSDNAALLRL